MILDQINHGPRPQVRRALLACADVPRWADAICDGRPYPDEAALLDRADRLAREITDDELAPPWPPIPGSETGHEVTRRRLRGPDRNRAG